MVQKTLPLLAVLAVSLAAVGGVAAADGTAIQTDETNGSTDDSPDMGVCVVGADSPCNDESTDGDAEPATHPTPLNGSDELGDGTDGAEHQMGIPEDQNDDGEIDEPFRGDDHERAENHIGGDDTDEDGRLWIPEDQNRDGEIDDRFGGDSLPALLFDILSLP